VLRFWGDDIKKNLDACVNEIREVMYEIINGIYNEGCDTMVDLQVAENEPAYL
jgi:hypothetical protein